MKDLVDQKILKVGDVIFFIAKKSGKEKTAEVFVTKSGQVVLKTPKKNFPSFTSWHESMKIAKKTRKYLLQQFFVKRNDVNLGSVASLKEASLK